MHVCNAYTQPRGYDEAEATPRPHCPLLVESTLDYFGEIAWASWPGLKTWYMRIKSRPCFRPLLADRFQGLAPVGHYADLDF